MVMRMPITDTATSSSMSVNARVGARGGRGPQTASRKGVPPEPACPALRVSGGGATAAQPTSPRPWLGDAAGGGSMAFGRSSGSRAIAYWPRLPTPGHPMGQWHRVRRSFPVTAAAPRRIRTCFPGAEGTLSMPLFYATGRRQSSGAPALRRRLAGAYCAGHRRLRRQRARAPRPRSAMVAGSGMTSGPGSWRAPKAKRP